jgi:hypothetical protein
MLGISSRISQFGQALAKLRVAHFSQSLALGRREGIHYAVSSSHALDLSIGSALAIDLREGFSHDILGRVGLT